MIAKYHVLTQAQEKKCLLPEDFQVVGFAPDQMSHEEFVNTIKSPVKLESPRFAEQLKDFCNRCSYVSGHEGGDKSFETLKRKLDEIGHGKKEQHRLFYMALPPSVFVPMSEKLKKHCYSEKGQSRLIVRLP